MNAINKFGMEIKLKEAQKGCSSRVLSYTDIEAGIRKTEIFLEQLKIPRKYWLGCKVHFLPSKVANSYGADAQGTFATFECRASGWLLSELVRKSVGSQRYGRTERVRLELSGLAKQNIGERFKINA